MNWVTVWTESELYRTINHCTLFSSHLCVNNFVLYAVVLKNRWSCFTVAFLFTILHDHTARPPTAHQSFVHSHISFLYLRSHWSSAAADPPINLSASAFLYCLFLPGLSQSEGVIILHPHGSDGAGREEVADHPRSWGGVIEGSVCTEGQPLSGVPLRRPPADSVQGQCLRRGSDRCLPVTDGHQAWF